MVFEVFQNFAPVNKKGKETRAKNILLCLCSVPKQTPYKINERHYNAWTECRSSPRKPSFGKISWEVVTQVNLQRHYVYNNQWPWCMVFPCSDAFPSSHARGLGMKLDGMTYNFLTFGRKCKWGFAGSSEVIKQLRCVPWLSSIMLATAAVLGGIPSPNLQTSVHCKVGRG